MSTPQPQLILAGQYINDAAPMTVTLPVTETLPAGTLAVLAAGSGIAVAPLPVLAAVTDNRGNPWAVAANNPNQRSTAIAACVLEHGLGPGDNLTVTAAQNLISRMQIIGILRPPGQSLTVGTTTQTSVNAASITLPNLGAAGPQGAVALAVKCQAGSQAVSSSTWPVLATIGATPLLRLFSSFAAAGTQIGALTVTTPSAAATSITGLAAGLVPMPPLEILTAGLPGARVGRHYASPAFEATGGLPPYVWAAGNLPPGLVMLADTIAGTPDQDSEGDWDVAVTVNDSDGITETVTLTLHIEPAPEPLPPRPGWTGPELRLPEDWTFFADTIIGSTPLGPVQPLAFSCERLLSDFGKGEVTLPVNNGAMDERRLLRLWSWRLWCYYGDALYWCGVPTGVRDEGASTATLTLSELTGYLEKRQWDKGPPNTRYTDVEQTLIGRYIAEPLEDVGVIITTNPGSGVLRTREYELLESESRAQLLRNLSAVGSAENQQAGPQFRTEYFIEAGLPRCRLRIAYPRVGSQTGLGVTVPGEATGYGAAWDADNLRTRTYAVGELPESAAEDAPRPVVMVDRPQPDLPRLDQADDYPSTWLESTLRERANTAASQYASPVLALSATATATTPALAGYGPGDTATIHVVSPLLPGGIEVAGQLTAIRVNAAENSAELEAAVTVPPPQPRATLPQRLGAIDSLLVGARRRGLAVIGEIR